METEALTSIVDVITGIPLSRAQKPTAKGDPLDAEVLMPQSVAASGVDRAVTERRQVYGAGAQFFTREGDIVLKASPPYDCAYIGAEDAGLLVTSACLILRPISEDGSVGRYLAAYFSGERGASELRAMSKGTTVRTIKKKELESAPIPVLSREARQKVAAAHERAHALKELCAAFERKCDLLLASELDRIIQNNDN